MFGISYPKAAGSRGMIIKNLSVFGLAHAMIDATSAAVVISLLAIYNIASAEFISLVILYNVIAFGLQSVFGYFTDRFNIPREIAIAGCLFALVSTVAVGFSPLLSVILVGVGNALFHVGGGSISLNLIPKRATAPGLYVAPGAFGLLIGTLVATSGYFVAWPFILLLLLTCFAILRIRIPRINYRPEGTKPGFRFFELILVLFLLTIVIRALVGLSLVFPWKADVNLLFPLIIAIVLGKGMGGVLADRLGWMRTAVISVLISAPLLSFGANLPVLAFLGAFLFNITMPVTLVGISNTIPGKPAFAFGLTTLALITGALVTYTGLKAVLSGQVAIFLIILASAAVLYAGLRQYGRLDVKI